MGLNLGILLYLVIAAVQDIRKKEISVIYLLCGGAFTMLAVIQSPKSFGISQIIGAFIGGVLFLISKVTKEAIGKADCMLVLYLGFIMGFSFCITTLFVAFFVCSIFCMILLVFRVINRNQRVAFIPFLTLGFFCSVQMI